jgi:hypothetical protein
MRELMDYLVSARLSGDVATPRASNHHNAKAFVQGVDVYQFGLRPVAEWSFEDVLGVMAERVGIDPDPARDTGADVIDPGLTAQALARLRERVRLAIEKRQRVLLGSGHPAGIIEVHLALAHALRQAGCEVLTPAVGASFEVDAAHSGDGREFQVRYVGGVAVCAQGGSALWHSHSPGGMRLMLAGLAAQRAPAPDLVIADHGFAGAAAAAGLDVVCFADSNDPALVVGEAEGRVTVTVPIDDNLQPHSYGPVADFLLA